MSSCVRARARVCVFRGVCVCVLCVRVCVWGGGGLLIGRTHTRMHSQSSDRRNSDI